VSAWDRAPVVLRYGDAYVVRDDLLPGGTKLRAIVPLLSRIGAAEYVYAGPPWGGGALALAHACRILGKRCTLFYAARKALVPRQIVAQSIGARLELVRPGYLTVVHARAEAYCRETGAHLIAWGVPDAEDAIVQTALRVQAPVREVWCATGSGTLLRALHRAFAPRGISVVGVRVGAEPRGVPDGARVVAHPLDFEQRTKVDVPFPSCRHYDAKAWEIALAQAKRPFLFWNVLGDTAAP
jgi:hypothetical protein